MLPTVTGGKPFDPGQPQRVFRKGGVYSLALLSIRLCKYSNRGIESVDQLMFQTTRLVSTEAYPGRKRCVHIVCSFTALLEHRVNTGRGKRKRIAYSAVSSTIDELSQLWLGEAKLGRIGDRGFRLSPRTFPNKRRGGVLH